MIYYILKNNFSYSEIPQGLIAVNFAIQNQIMTLQVILTITFCGLLGLLLIVFRWFITHGGGNESSSLQQYPLTDLICLFEKREGDWERR